MSTGQAQGTGGAGSSTLGGSGMSPVAPGTFGSLAAVIILGAIFFGHRVQHAGPSPQHVWNVILAAGILIYRALCVALGKWATEYYGRKDPGACVLDEGAGICLTALFVPIYPGGRELLGAAGRSLSSFEFSTSSNSPPQNSSKNCPTDGASC